MRETIVMQVGVRLGILIGFVIVPITPAVTYAQLSDALAIPTQEIRCRTRGIDVSATPAEKFLFEFEEGSELTSGRAMQATFDPNGRPVILVIIVNAIDSAHRLQIVAYSFRFTGDLQGVELKRGDAASPTLDKAALLSVDTIEHARKLAEWLWLHRCDRS